MSRDEPAVNDDMNAVTSVEIDLELKLEAIVRILEQM